MTTETNAERLERVKAEKQHVLMDYYDGVPIQDLLDINWLIQQAERVQELENAVEGLGKAVEIYSEMPLNEALELLLKITQEDSK